jgi:4-carboxymuconolactone decarboxylase
VSYLVGVTEPPTAHTFNARLGLLAPDPEGRARGLAIYAGTIALADESAMSRSVTALRTIDTVRTHLYEIVLQSYLFLGFPRMLIAAENLSLAWPAERPTVAVSAGADFERWKESGQSLYSHVYGGNAERLKDRVMLFAPEIFEWMIVEGYGKVLSRLGLDIVSRELAVVAFLIVDNRPKQLASHIRGALRVGVTAGQIGNTIADLELVAANGAREARRILDQLGVR